ncbi:hypothetical protein CPB86DRAFT_166189 [Serendipita vermifera]|nr:hypothetical protein CPB86DRAFT_166189 [Serendipita vermifera]
MALEAQEVRDEKRKIAPNLLWWNVRRSGLGPRLRSWLTIPHLVLCRLSLPPLLLLNNRRLHLGLPTLLTWRRLSRGRPSLLLLLGLLSPRELLDIRLRLR